MKNIKIVAGPDSFSLAHLSDLHLTSLGNIKTSQLLSKRILGYLSWLHKRRLVHRREIIESLLEDLRDTRPDHVAVTGDLTHLGLPMEYAEVEQWLPSLGTPEHVTVIPGNHDAYAGKDWVNSYSSWSPYLDSDGELDTPKAAGFFPSLRIRGQVALIGLSSAIPTLPLLATGTIGQKQLSGLDTLLEKTGEEGFFRVILVHHPPVAGIIKWRKRLTDDRMFAAVLARQGAELVLHGHAHTATLSELQTPAGHVPVVGAPSASELNPWNGHCAKYNIYQINRIGKNWELKMTVRGYSEDQGRFVSETERSLKLP
ncbi:MAG: metallophosphoesterase [Candidatus Marinimicrobia bacterium]|nr:metallophosphoesterase [Candidatus Neomarinimicrobiota bacterium]